MKNFAVEIISKLKSMQPEHQPANISTDSYKQQKSVKELSSVFESNI